MRVCQILIVANLMLWILQELWRCMYGRQAEQPYGFGGVILLMIFAWVTFVVLAKAGAFSTLF